MAVDVYDLQRKLRDRTAYLFLAVAFLGPLSVGFFMPKKEKSLSYCEHVLAAHDHLIDAGSDTVAPAVDTLAKIAKECAEQIKYEEEDRAVPDRPFFRGMG